MPETQLSAADLIKRFREAKPTSAEQRRSALGGSRAKMWWEDTESESRVSASSVSYRGRGAVKTMEESPLPRESRSLVTPDEPPRREHSPYSSFSALRERERVKDRESDRLGERERERARERERDRGLFDESLSLSRMSFGGRDPLRESETHRARARVSERETESGFRDRTFSLSLDAEASLQHQLHALTEEVRRKENDTLRRLRGTHFDFGAQQRASRTGAGGAGVGDTLGSTGLLSLLRSDLKLDGVKPAAPAEPAAAPAAISEPTALTAEELNAQLEKVLADLKSKNALSAEDENAPPRSAFLPEGVAETIPQITAQLEIEMDVHLTALQRRHAAEDESTAASAAAQDAAKETARQEGREEVRKQRLLDVIESPVARPLDLLSVWRGAAAVPVLERERERERDVLGDSEEEEEDALRRIHAQHARERPQQRVAHDAALVMQRAIDSEISSAEHIFKQMRGMRAQLGHQMLRLHAATDCTPPPVHVDVRVTTPSYNAVRPHTVRVPPVWGLDPQEAEEIAIQRWGEEERDVRGVFNPYPELVHTNILSVTQAVESSLNVAMDLLQKRLPSPAPAPPEPAAPPALLSFVVPTPPVKETETHPEAEKEKEKEKETAKEQESKDEHVNSSLEFDLSLSLPASPANAPTTPTAPTAPSESPKVAEASPPIDVKSHLQAIDALLGPEELVQYKPLAAHRFDRFLSSNNASPFTDAPREPLVLDPLRDVRQERAVHFVSPPPSLSSSERERERATPSAPPPAPQLLPQSSSFLSSSAARAFAPTSPSLRVPSMASTPARAVEGSAMTYLKAQQQQQRPQSASSSPSSVAAIHSIYYASPTNAHTGGTRDGFLHAAPSFGANISEREAYLQRMRAMRQNIMSSRG